MNISPEASEVIGEHTQETIKRHITVVDTYIEKGVKRKYSKKKIAQKVYFNAGFDFMQYNFVVRDFIVKMFALKNQAELDILCYLFPIQLFTIKDFNVLPVKRWGMSFKQMQEDGYITIKVKNRTQRATVYSLSDHANKAVRDYYYYLSGEKTINIKSILNPYKKPNDTKINLQREKVMLKLKKQSQNFPNLFKNYHD